ncbi:MAG: iron-sulfur cluster assembly accessory protein [Legionellaceae bacterium]|nr:iron-sulfur cluster assembly accessory protein [Legionellaceae bacterium]
MNNTVEQVRATDVALVISQAAKAHFVAWLEKEPSAVGLRLSLKKSGCSGLAYVLDSITAVPEHDIAVPLTEQFWVYIDKASYPFIKGTEIDFVREGLNTRLIYKNPNQTGECGCGESFTVNS